MATLYQLHSPMDRLKGCVNEMALTWRRGDSIILLGSTFAFIDWFKAYVDESDIEGIASIYALEQDIAQLHDNTAAKLNLPAKLSAILTDNDWVAMTQGTDFDKVVTIGL